MKARERLAASPPDGLAVKAHLSSLHAFYIRYAAERQAKTFAEAEEINHPPSSKIFSLAEGAVHAGAFQLSTSPIDTDSFRELRHWVCTQQSNSLRRDAVRLSQQALDLRERRFAFDREKFELNAAQLALEHVAALQRIRRDPALDTAARIRAAREQLYGSLPPATENKFLPEDDPTHAEASIDGGVPL